MKQEIFQHYSRVLDELIDTYDFCKFYFQNPTSLDYTLKSEELDISLTCGVSRGCVIDDAYDWVVKFDFDDCRDQEASCRTEVDTYEEALRDGLEDFFAKPLYLGEYCRKVKFYDWNDLYYDMDIECIEGFEDCLFNDCVNRLEEDDIEMKEEPIYLRLYAYPRAKEFRYPCIDNRTVRSLRHSPLTEKNAIVGYVFETHYDADQLERFIEFLEEHDINDLHCGNVGEIGGMPVLIDYAGYHSDDKYY